MRTVLLSIFSETRLILEVAVLKITPTTPGGGGGGGTLYNGLYREAPPERGTFFRLEIYKKVGILGVEV